MKLVQSIDNVRETSRIQTECVRFYPVCLAKRRPATNSGLTPLVDRWFGLILLPIVSFSADGVIAIWKFFESNFAAPLVSKLPRSVSDRLKDLRTRLRRAFRTESLSSVGFQGSSDADDGDEPEFAHGRPIDLSIQFTLWWTPFLVLLGWWTDRPMHLLFDYFEVAMLLGACFLVNYILSDSKTNMAEGLTMISFYAMIVSLYFLPILCNSSEVELNAYRRRRCGSILDNRRSRSCSPVPVLLRRPLLAALRGSVIWLHFE